MKRDRYDGIADVERGVTRPALWDVALPGESCVIKMAILTASAFQTHRTLALALFAVA